jgi:hypothetical protein
MSQVNFNNSQSYLLETDYDLFYKVTGSTIEGLEQEIKNNSATHSEVYSSKKFVNNENLNKLGLHVYRVLLARRVYEKRAEGNDDFDKNGFKVYENFLPEQLFNNLVSVFKNEVEPNHQKGGVIPVNPKPFLQMPRLLDIIKKSSHISDFKFSFPNASFWHVLQKENDDQAKYHSDTFQPTIKCWVYLDDVAINNGPFHFVPKSHIVDENRLRWEKENSLSEEGSELWRQRDGKGGSFRVLKDSTVEEEDIFIKNMGYTPLPMVGKKNSLVVADTFGLHKRGLGDIGTYRSSLTLEYRPQPFYIY